MPIKTLLKDLFIVGSCVLVFAATVTLTAEREHRRAEARQAAPAGPPFAGIAQALDLPADTVRNAFEKVGPPAGAPLQPPSEQQLAEHSRKLALALDVPTDRLRSVLATYMRPPPR